MNVIKRLYEICQIAWDFFRNQRFFSKHPFHVTVLGSDRFLKQDPYTQQAYELGCGLAQRGYTVLTGGGHGVMEAVCQGVTAHHGLSIGCVVKKIESIHPYYLKTLTFDSLLSRQSALIQYSLALVVFPGGFGTLSELLNALLFIQNRKKTLPIFLIGTTFWTPLIEYFKTFLFSEYKTIDAKDLDCITITDMIEDIYPNLPSQPPM